ncbi:MAG TPA: TlpA disulfide reductase family protein [Candidatus Limnocylindrales bacterium]|nr:TlpA disulfide reductase family protein [Candidatus Limnocylindrales bacterium]
MTSPAGDRRARRQARREEARRAESAGAARSRWLIPGVVAAAIVVAAILAIVLPGAGQQGGGGSSSLPPATSGPITEASGSAAASGVAVITGASLPDFQNPNGDPAVGMPAPEVQGTSFDGTPVAIANDGRPKVVLFLAHWCPHCQAEVPLVQAWVNSGGVPDGVDLISVATSIDPAAPNYPPDAWLAREGWTAPVLADSTNSVAGAYGLTKFPYWVFIGPDGTVRARASGELPIANLESAIRGLTGG